MINTPSYRPSFRRRFATPVLFIAIALFADVGAYETDQLTNRSQDIADSREVLNREVNITIRAVVAEWDTGQSADPMHVVDAIYRKIGGWNWVDKLERFAMFSPEIDRIDAPRWDSVYGDMPLWRTRIVYFTGVSKTIRVHETLIGTDKIGHFISSGRKFFRRYLRYGSEARAAQRSASTERGLFGRALAGSYSNADLVANYEGYRFFRSLFEDGVVGGKPSILRWKRDRWVVQRDFDWADHVNDYWDEALNVSHYDALLYGRMMERFIDFCDDYWRDPAAYSVGGETELKQRYAHLELRDNRTLRLDSLCPIYAAEIAGPAVAHVGDRMSAERRLGP